MVGPELWQWTWRAEEGWSFPFGLTDEGGPLDDDAWAATRLALYRHAYHIYNMCIAFDGALVTISGSVANERTKAQIEELISRHGLRVRNALEVHAPFTPATDINYLSDTKITRPTETVSCDAVIESAAAPVVGKRFEFLVGLSRDSNPETEGPSITVAKVSSGWTELEIDVNVRSPHLHFEDGAKAGLIRLRSDGDKDVCQFVGTVSTAAIDLGEVEIWADFTYNRRHSGTVRKVFKAQVTPTAS